MIHRVTPTVLDLWYSIGSVNRFLMCYCAATLPLDNEQMRRGEVVLNG